MAIVYDVPNNKITVTGYTAESRGQFGADILAADAGGGWGVFFNPVGKQFYSTAHIQIGNGSTETYVESLYEMFHLADALNFQVLNAADMNVGGMYGSWGHQGSHWSIGHTADLDILPNGNAGALRILGSHFHTRSANRTRFNGGTLVTNRSTMSALWAGSGTYRRFEFISGDITLDDVVFQDVNCIFLSCSPTLMRDIRVHRANRVLTAAYCGEITVSGLAFSSITSGTIFYVVGAKVNCVDPGTPLSVPSIVGAKRLEQGALYLHHPRHRRRRHGNDDTAASVLCKDKDGNTVFNVDTDGSGNIAVQTGVYRQWAGAAETLTNYFPFDFTVTFGDGLKFIVPTVPWDAPLSAGQPWEIHHPDYAVAGDVKVGTVCADGSIVGSFAGALPEVQITQPTVQGIVLTETQDTITLEAG